VQRLAEGESDAERDSERDDADGGADEAEAAAAPCAVARPHGA
jgi:hypothetical protein